MKGIIVADKPAGWTSHDVIAKLRGILKERRAGHGGTLDPMATGVLPVFLGRATRAIEFCENAEKEYIAGLRLGIVTDTQDITGSILSVRDCNVSHKEFSEVTAKFLGQQEQIPPMYSAIKISGQKLYELARRGVEVERPARKINISEIEILSQLENEFTLRIVCSKGTYIRTICHDIGAALGCGGTMTSLRRTRAGIFSTGMARTIEEIKETVLSGDISGILIPVDKLFSEYPALTIGRGDTKKCKNGAVCRAANSPDGMYRVYDPDGEFLILGTVKDGALKTVKSFFEV